MIVLLFCTACASRCEQESDENHFTLSCNPLNGERSAELVLDEGDSILVHIEKESGCYIVTGPAMEQLIDSVNFNDQESLNYFHRTLRSRGVIDALRAAGAKEGDSVVIGDMEFDFVE